MYFHHTGGRRRVTAFSSVPLSKGDVLTTRVCLHSVFLVWVYPRETPPHIRTARASPQRHTTAGTAAPTTADTGNTVPQRANPLFLCFCSCEPQRLTS